MRRSSRSRRSQPSNHSAVDVVGSSCWAELPDTLLVHVLNTACSVHTAVLVSAVSRDWRRAELLRTRVETASWFPVQLLAARPALRALSLLRVPLMPSQINRVGEIVAASRIGALSLYRVNCPPRFLERALGLHTLTLCAVDGLSDNSASKISEWLPSLTAVNLAGTRCADLTCKALADLKLTTLNLSSTRVSDLGISALCSGIAAGSLQALHVGGSLVQLRVKLELPVLQELFCSYRGDLLRGEVWRAPSRVCSDACSSVAGNCRQLRRLELDGSSRLCDTTPVASLEHLCELSLAYCPNLLQQWAHHRACPNLTHLNLSGTAVDEPCLEAIGQLRQLQQLLLTHSRIPSTAVRLLFGSRALASLHTLSLFGTSVDDSTANDWDLVPRPARLQWLDLGATKVGDRTCRALSGLPMKALNLGDTRVTASGIGLLKMPDKCVLNLFGSSLMIASITTEGARPGTLLPAFQEMH